MVCHIEGRKMFTEALRGTWHPLVQGKGILLFFSMRASVGTAPSKGNSV